MACLPVCGENPRSLIVSGLSVQVDKHGISKKNYISVDLAHHEIFHTKVGRGGISVLNTRQGSNKKWLLLAWLWYITKDELL